MLTPGQRLGPYEVVDALGSGGMGEVYRARDPRLGRDVAVKVVRSTGAPEPDRLERFEREARAVAALSHPNVLTVHDVGHENGHPYVVFELLEGETLRDRLERGPLPMRRAVEVAVEVCRGLEAAHGRELVHRDLKPENVFLTTDGRVKILDFGLAKLRKGEGIGELAGDERLEPGGALAAPPEDTRTADGVILGTLGYLSPEQARGLTADARSDLFALGAVLYEMISGRRAFKGKTPADTLSAILQKDPPALGSGSGPLPPAAEQIVRRCLAKEPDERFHSAHDLGLALETLLERSGSGGTLVAEAEEREPYPGLASFGEEDSRRFFGREGEAEALWRRLRDRKLLAVIGPSGAGKTSFVRAGVVASRPPGWGAVVATPGTSPLSMLGQALAPALASDPEALPQLVRFEDPGVAYEVLTRWRRSHERALLVVDQFEELFTLNPPEVQETFATLLGRLASEGEITALLSMRDDFLMRCQDHEALAPVFDSLTPLGPLSGAALRRAVEEPATAEGFRFEDGLVDTMLEAVEGERGALPLLAFAVSRLWEHRDRERHLLTHEAYGDIGGVAGALARHAEATLERIGPDRRPVVREIFRNLVTSQETRAVVEREELLSVFADRAVAAEVLDELIRSRLLTSYESTDPQSSRGAPTPLGDEGSTIPAPTHRIEIVHESLLTSWLRLVRWQAQDAAGALLRDQLKQAARLWDDRGRPEDLLWTGASYLEFRAWRARYPGGLSSLEDDFAHAMTAHASRRRRQRRLAAVAVVVTLALGLGVVTVFWARSEASRERAAGETLRAEASKLIALGLGAMEESPSAALAHAIRSLELSDTHEGRLAALRAIQRGPTARVYTDGQDKYSLHFSADGHRLAIGGFGGAHVRPRDGGPPILLEFPSRGLGAGLIGVGLTPAGDTLVTTRGGEVQAWALPEGRELWRATADHPEEKWSWHLMRGSRIFTVGELSEPQGEYTWVVRQWDTERGESQVVGLAEGPGNIDPRGRFYAYQRGRRIFVRSLDSWDEPWLLGEHGHEVEVLEVGADGEVLVAQDASGEVRVWSTTGPGLPPRRILSPGPGGGLTLGPAGRWVATTSEERTQSVALLWDLEAPRGTEPLRLRRSVPAWRGLAFHPGGEWFASNFAAEGAFWWLGGPHPRVFSSPGNRLVGSVFSPGSQHVLTISAAGHLQKWPVDTHGGEPRVLLETPGAPILSIKAGRRERRVLIAAWNRVLSVPLEGGPPRELAAFSGDANVAAFAVSPDGRRLVTAALHAPPDERLVEVWDLEDGTKETVAPVPGVSDTDHGVWSLDWLDDDTAVASVYPTGLVAFELKDGSHRTLCPEIRLGAVLSSSGRFVVGLDSPGLSDFAPATLLKCGLKGEGATPLPSHGDRLALAALALDPTDSLIASGSQDGTVRIGPVSGEEPHILLGHEGNVFGVAFSPDGRWLASTGFDGTIRLWPVPDMSRPPLHTLPREELLRRLRTFTNLRVVPDPASATGYAVEPGPFPGWASSPEW